MGSVICTDARSSQRLVGAGSGQAQTRAPATLRVAPPCIMIGLQPDRPTPVLYLDLDGTVRHGFDELGRFVNGPDDVVIFPEAVEMMRRWKSGGGRIVGVSNQGGIALGHMTTQDCAATMARTFVLSGQLFDKILWCRHHPDAQELAMASCWCRKPAFGLLIEATLYMTREYPGEFYPVHMSLMVGDRPEDEECARNAGIDFQWAHEWRAQV